jgi:ATP-binding cassette subfamily B protein
MSNPPAPTSPLKMASLLKLMTTSTRDFVLAALGLLFNTVVSLAAPFIFGRVVDTYIKAGNYTGVLFYVAVLFIAFVITYFVSYFQMILMGTIGQTVLFRLRNNVFTKLQSLPIAFFHQTKAGDLISRINNDTDKLNQFFSETLMRFFGSIFIIIGAGIFMVVLNPRLGLLALLPAAIMLVITQLTGKWVKQRNAASLQSTGSLSAEIQESLDNFKVIVAFNRRDYFRARFDEVNQKNFKASFKAGATNNLFTPLYDLSSSIGQLLVVGYGILLITQGQFTLGLLLSFLIYLDRFYSPLRMIAALWTNLQLAVAGWDRVSAILNNPLQLATITSTTKARAESLLEFQNVSFNYPDGKSVLKHISFDLEPGKTYALVGPTGGGKTTTASLMARLYDASEGTVLLHGQDIRSYTAEDRAKQIGFILQEPFLFTGTILENIFHGNSEFIGKSKEDYLAAITASGLDPLLARFPEGLETVVKSSGDGISLGQRQLIAFMRAVLRKPDLLILDEATANIDTVTEQLLEETLTKLPKTTTKVIIAHRLNTIENADEIFFVNDGTVTAAGSFDHALELLMHGERKS